MTASLKQLARTLDCRAQRYTQSNHYEKQQHQVHLVLHFDSFLGTGKQTSFARVTCSIDSAYIVAD